MISDIPQIAGFDNAWKTIANSDKEKLSRMQYLYCREKYYDKYVEDINQEINFDFNQRGYTLKNILWSRVIQHGNANCVKEALKNVDLEKATDEEIIKAIYKESAMVVDIPPNEKSIPMIGDEA